MQRHTTVLITILIVLVVGAALAIGLTQGKTVSGMCRDAAPAAYTITIRNNKASPRQINGKLCDSLTFKNLDNITREVAFGPHENHVPYDGVSERVLNKGESFTITFDKTGRYHWHDHLHDTIGGYFIVTK